MEHWTSTSARMDCWCPSSTSSRGRWKRGPSCTWLACCTVSWAWPSSPIFSWAPSKRSPAPPERCCSFSVFFFGVYSLPLAVGSHEGTLANKQNSPGYSPLSTSHVNLYHGSGRGVVRDSIDFAAYTIFRPSGNTVTAKIAPLISYLRSLTWLFNLPSAYDISFTKRTGGGGGG